MQDLLHSPPPRRGRWTRGLIVTLGAALAATLVGAPPAVAAPFHPGRAQKDKPVAGVRVKPGKVDTPKTGTPFKAPAPVWPAAGTAEVALDSAAPRLAGQSAGAVRAGTSPVWVEAATGERQAIAAAAPGPVKVQTYDHATSAKAGADGLVFRVSGTATAKVSVDYSAFRGAYGADWAARLRLTALPECALSTPDLPECQGTPLESRNDPRANTVSATVDLGRPTTTAKAAPSLSAASGGALFALSAGTSSGSGTYAATPLAPSTLWSAGGNAGAFSWSYPMRTPPALGGPAPQLKLGYSSASVDGLMAATNNQPSWAGAGFDLNPGYIERRYRPCQDDMDNGANNTEKTGDQCWATDNATLSFGAHGGELIKDGANPNRWHPRDDDGTLVEHRTGAGNGAQDGEYWVVTTTDGTQYWFGGKSAANSTWTLPVAGNHAGEPCHATAFADSFCAQAYRWNLDYVVDTHANTMTYWYVKETNKYGKNNKTTDPIGYDRGGYLSRIDYGTRSDRTESAPMQVVFDTADRCLADCGTHDATHWPDVPWDSDCAASPCKLLGPTFWTTRRLATVTTKVAGNPVDAWTFTHSFPDPGDGTKAGLWLERIGHKGLVRGTATAPDVVFGGVQRNNRVDTASDQYAAMNWWRVNRITLETGGLITVTYSDPDCVAGSRMPDPNALENNHLRCYPVYWQPEGKAAPILDFFHKYVVTDVTETDPYGGAPRTLTHYDYLGDPFWHFSDDDGLVRADKKTWSQWRGYGAVRTTKGDPGEKTSSETRFFRGMNGDHLPSGTRSVSLPAIAAGSVPATPDEDAFAGQVRETIVYDGAAEVSATVTEPAQSDPTATRTINGTTVYARFAHPAVAHTRTALDKGRGYRTTTVRSSYDSTYGTVTRVEDLGDDAVTGDESCTITDYARNTGAWLVASAKRIQKYAVDCGKADAGAYTAAEVVGDNRMSFDQQAFGAAPTKGEVTRNEELTSLAGSRSYATVARSDFDKYGRVLANYDVRGNKTSTAYTPVEGGPVTNTTTTSPLGWVSTATLDGAWGVATSTVDPNGRRSDQEFDPLGRLTGVWFPGRDKGAPQSANITYSYLTRDNGPSVVTTSNLTPDGGYRRTQQLYDGLGRLRQTQSADAAGGPNAVVADTLYDTAGRAARANNAYLSKVPPGTDLITPTEVIPVQQVTEFDGAGRATAQVVRLSAPPGGSPGGTEKWRTTTGYGGDRTDLTPPSGGIVTSVLTDAGGRAVERRQYHAGVAAGSDDPTGYDATRYTYDRRDQQTRVTDPTGRHWDTTYDLRGAAVHVEDPDAGARDTVYNDAGDVVSTTDAHGTLAYTYDQIGRKLTTRSGSTTGPKLLEWAYDTLGNGTTVYGQLVKSTRYVNGNAYSNETTGYTVDYQATGTSITIPSTEGGVDGTYNYAFTFKQDGSPLTSRIPALGDVKQETLTYAYDGQGRLRTVKSGYGTSTPTMMVTRTGYTSFGEVGDYTLQNNNGNVVSVTRTYETDTRRLAQIWTAKQTSPTMVSDIRFNYDNAGNVTKIADLAAGDTQCFQTDHLRRLTNAWTPGNGDCAAAPSTAALGGPAPYWQSYGFDATGNRTSLVEHGTANGDRTTSYTVAPGKHLVTGTSTVDGTGTKTAGYTFTPAGDTETRPSANGTQTLTWDAEGHLATAKDSTGLTSYIYDANGTRLVRIDPTGKTLYLPGQELRYTTLGGARTGTRYYTHAGSSVAMRTGSGVTWLSSDQHGTATVSISAGSQAVATRRQTPFGAVRGSTGTWAPQFDKGFLGGTNDNTGLTHLGVREYDPALGRFISRDRVLRPDDPQQLNGYAYANNSPATFTDPTGLDWLDSLCDTASDFVDTAKEVYDRTNLPLFAMGVGVMVLGGMSDVAGGALIATGVGAPLGAAIIVGATELEIAGAGIAITAVAAPNLDYAYRNSDDGGGGGDGDSSAPNPKPQPRKYEAEAQQLRDEYVNTDSTATPLTEGNSFKALEGPEGTKPVIKPSNGPIGKKVNDIDFVDANGNVVSRVEVKSLSEGTSDRVFRDRLEDGAEQVQYDGEIFYQVPKNTKMSDYIGKWNTKGRRANVDFTKYSKVTVRFVDEEGGELGRYSLETGQPVEPALQPPGANPPAPRYPGRWKNDF
ncbi:RHS repeat-associated core domain-containing protein [Longispora sp. K20-0274]|uniref:RHS repeat-associated core domain-containing protein n=1 Tax=Longispora sp. K20-0274 TaxID=3088255 RepID=UPI00399970CF